MALVALCLFLPRGANAQDSGTIRLTSDGISYPISWNPDGSGLLITRLSGKVEIATGWQLLTDLWRVDLAGNQVLLAQNASYPVLSPDGGKVAYLSFNGSDQADLHVLDLRTGQAPMIARADWGRPLQWSPVGQGLIFVRSGSAWLIRPGESEPHRLAGDLAAAAFQFSPRGDRWAANTDAGLRLLRPGNAPVILTPGKRARSFAWSPGGDRLAFVVGDELWTASADGFSRRRLLAAPGEYLGPPRWSPDGRRIAILRAALHAAGPSESRLWIVSADGTKSEAVTTNVPVDGSPLWSPDGRWLAFASEGNVVLLDMTAPPPSPPAGGGTPTSQIPAPLPAAGPRALALGQQLAPPSTIRVLHDDNLNSCRGVPDGQIDVIDFETYVKRVVPHEMPAGWSPEALRAQAVAARTYAWYYILQNHQDWDVKDSVAYQLMCDSQDPRTDAAVDATRGQYIAYEGLPILAEYAAENGSPTVARAGYPYLQAVDDPVSFGRTRLGHGRGMGQAGALRWASSPFRWTYQQILSHYYTGVSIEPPAGPSSDSTPPLGAVVLPWSGSYLTSSRVLIRANAGDDASGVAQADFWARFWDGSTERTVMLVRDTDGSDGWQTVWDLSGLPDQPLTDGGIAITVTLRDAGGNEADGLAGVQVGLDRIPPTGSLDIPIAASQTLSVPLTISGSDAAGGSGLAGMGFSNDWRWEEHALYRQKIGGSQYVGHVVSDTDARNGLAFYAQAGSDPPGAWYGPYTKDLPAGHAYRAYFRLKTGNVTTPEEVAYLDVVDEKGAKVLGVHRVRGTDFRQAGVYQEFAVDFDYQEASTTGLEFRTAFRGVADLWLDRVLVTSYPQPFATSATWTIRDRPGWQEVIAKLVDGAGNVSDDLRDRVYYLPPPIAWQSFQPSSWVTSTLSPTAQVIAQAGAGLDLTSARYRYSRDGGRTWSSWLSSLSEATKDVPQGHTLIAPTIPFEQDSLSQNWVQFRVADLQGTVGFSPAYVVPIDTQAPTVTLQSPPLVTSPVFTVTWHGEDDTSGVYAFDVQVRDGPAGEWTPWLLDTTELAAPFAGQPGHRYYFRARARDAAGNESAYAPGLGQSSTRVVGQADTYLPIVMTGAAALPPYPSPRTR
jgi:hypothetical protein